MGPADFFGRIWVVQSCDSHEATSRLLSFPGNDVGFNVGNILADVWFLIGAYGPNVTRLHTGMACSISRAASVITHLSTIRTLTESNWIQLRMGSLQASSMILSSLLLLIICCFFEFEMLTTRSPIFCR
jgi:hypothetical protein